MKSTINKNINFLYFLPGLIILVVGMLTLHTSVKLSSEQLMLEQYHEVISAQHLSITGQQHSAEVRRIQTLNQTIQMRERWLYWSVIAISLTAFILLILNAHKLRQLEFLNTEKQTALRLLQQRLAAIEASYEGIGIVDGDGNLTYMNPALLKLHGISPDQRQKYIGQPWLTLYTSKGQGEIAEAVIPEFEEQGFWQGKSKLLRRDGETVHAELSMTRLDDGGFIGTARDVTEQEKADEDKREMRDQLYQAQKMEAVGRLAGGIAHDFNNILAAMNGYAEFLSEDLENDSQPQKFALNILQAGKQARALVDSILTFSRQQNNEIENIDLCVPLQESLSMLQATLPKTIEVETDINLRKAPIDANATQVSQMVMNLCVNASDSMENEKGKINVSLSQPDLIKEDIPLSLMKSELPDPHKTPLIRIVDGEPDQCLLYLGHFVKNQDYIKLSIGDTGTGMSRIIIEKIFEPFFTTKDVHKGTGLGLSSVHGTVIAHRGVLIIDSTVGQGTSFNVFFPVSVAEDTEQHAQEEIYQEKSGDGVVLVVDDQLDVQIMTAIMLERLGYEVEAVSSGFEALDLLREVPDKFDLVLTDQNMPKMTGLELIEQAHEDFPDLPFVLLSGYSEEKLEDLTKEHPAVKAIIRKPTSQKELGQTLSQVLMEDSHEKEAVA